MSFGDDTDDRPGGGMNLDLRYWFWLFRRRFWLFALVAVTLSAAGLAVAFVLPPTYEARARLLVESQQIPSDLVRSTVNASAIEQIEVIKQRLLTRDTLLELAARHAVFSDADRMTPTQRADAMRRAIDFDQRVLGGSRRSDTVSTAFSISFRSERPATAAGVVNDLVTRVLRQSSELRRNRAETTADYFRQEVERLSDELTDIEGRIVAFQEEHKGALPDSLAYRRSQLDSVQERLQALEMERIELKQEREILRSAVGEGVAGPSVVGETQRELAELRRLIIRRSAILTEDHPEIRSLRRRIEALERVAEAEATVAESARASGAAERAEAVDPALRELRRQLAVVEARLEFGAEVFADLEAERDRLARSLEETPNVQMELGVLNRAYRTLEARYGASLSKLAEAEAGEELEDKQRGERFEVIEQATVPDEPVAPNRRKYAVLGGGAGVGGGLALIVLLEMMSGVIRRPEDLARIGREPAGVIPYISTPGERRWIWTFRIASFVVIVGGGAAALWALHTYYLPLETIVEKVLERSGAEGALDMARRRFGL